MPVSEFTIWDFIYFRNHSGLSDYLNQLAALDFEEFCKLEKEKLVASKWNQNEKKVNSSDQQLKQQNVNMIDQDEHGKEKNSILNALNILFNTSNDSFGTVNGQFHASDNQNQIFFESVLARLLSQYVQQSTRWIFFNPVFGTHGYYHCRDATRKDSVAECRGLLPLNIENISTDALGSADVLPQFVIVVPKSTTALHYAVMMNSKECLHVLLSFGADLFLKNEHGMTPFELAKHVNADAQIIQMLYSFKFYIHHLLMRVKGLEKNVVDLEKVNDQTLEKLTDIERKREEYKSNVKRATLREMVLLQWKLAITIIRAEKNDAENANSQNELKTLRKRVSLLEKEKYSWFQDKKSIQEQNSNLRLKVSNLERDFEDLQMSSLKNGNNMEPLASLQRERERVKDLQRKISVLEEKLQKTPTLINGISEFPRDLRTSLPRETPQSPISIAKANDSESALQEELADLQSAFDTCHDLLKETENDNQELKSEIDRLKAEISQKNQLLAVAGLKKENPSACCMLS